MYSNHTASRGMMGALLCFSNTAVPVESQKKPAAEVRFFFAIPSLVQFAPVSQRRVHSFFDLLLLVSRALLVFFE
jgi:hypothetical protein